MSLEVGTYINSLVATNPLANDPRSEGDDHIRLIKATLLATFPNIAGAVTPTHTELNFVDGVTSPIQTQLDALSSGKASIPAGTPMLFYTATAPTGWTQVTTHNNKALRVVSGTGAGSGGTTAFTTAFSAQIPSGTIGGTALTEAQLPPHIHYSGQGYQGHGGTADVLVVGNGAPLTNPTSSTGSGAPHTHSFTGNALSLAVQYVDIIIATRN